MIKPPVKKVHNHKTVWVHQVTDSMRQSDNLCFNCSELKYTESELIKCHLAGQLFHMENQSGIAVTVTCCPIWKAKINAS